MKDIKKEMIEKSAEDFQKLNEDSKMFILGYMVGIQQERLKQNPDDKIKESNEIRGSNEGIYRSRNLPNYSRLRSHYSRATIWRRSLCP